MNYLHAWMRCETVSTETGLASSVLSTFVIVHNVGYPEAFGSELAKVRKCNSELCSIELTL